MNIKNDTTQNLDLYFSVISNIEENPQISQRDLASKLGFSLGKINFIVQSLVSKGIIKLERFATSTNKRAYRYVFTPTGVKEKYKITSEYVRKKEAEYAEIAVNLERAKKMMENFSEL